MPLVLCQPYFAAAAAAPVTPVTSADATNLLMHFNGTNNGTSFNDEMGHAVSVLGGVVTSTTKSKFGGAAAYFPFTSGSYLKTGGPDLAFGLNDFTIECWANWTTLGSGASARPLFQISTAANGLSPSASNNVAILSDRFSNGAIGWFAANTSGTTTTFPTVNTWNHVAMTRSAGTTRIFFNGQIIATITDSANYTGGNVAIGAVYNTDSAMDGYIDEFRVINGIAKYTSAFTPPTAAFTNVQADAFYDNVTVLMHGEDLTDVKGNVFTALNTVTSSTAQKKFGTGSILFTPGSCLKTAANTLATGLADFTVEAWIYPTAGIPTNGSTLFSWKASSGTASTGAVGFNAAGRLEWGTTAGTIVSTNVLYVQNTWQHVAFARQGNNLYLFHNGALVGTGTDTNSYTSPNGFAIGNRTDNPGTTYYTGHMDEIRLTIGQARYTQTFSLPTTAFPNIGPSDRNFAANSLLVDTDTGVLIDSTGKNTFTLTGTSPVSSAQARFGANSMYFDGTRAVACSSLDTLKFGTGVGAGVGDFTIEAWVYVPTGSSGWRQIISSRNSSSVGEAGQLSLSITANNFYAFGSAVSTGNYVLNTAPVVFNTWTHLAVTRSSGTVRLFVNGALIGSISDASTYTGAAAMIGANGGGSEKFVGYIDELRVTKGVARYLTTFGPPTSPFPRS